MVKFLPPDEQTPEQRAAFANCVEFLAQSAAPAAPAPNGWEPVCREIDNAGHCSNTDRLAVPGTGLDFVMETDRAEAHGREY